MKFKEYLEKLNNEAKENPECLEYEVIYSHDDEGNEYQKVNDTPYLMEISNIEESRFLEPVYDETGEYPGSNYNAILIN